ncbi:hypothetical protein OC835_000374 [Tilletia horrida]|nr:hypothetical protein OC835_000374 [Tilletia horrida]
MSTSTPGSPKSVQSPLSTSTTTTTTTSSTDYFGIAAAAAAIHPPPGAVEVSTAPLQHLYAPTTTSISTAAAHSSPLPPAPAAAAAAAAASTMLPPTTTTTIYGGPARPEKPFDTASWAAWLSAYSRGEWHQQQQQQQQQQQHGCKVTAMPTEQPTTEPPPRSAPTSEAGSSETRTAILQHTPSTSNTAPASASVSASGRPSILRNPSAACARDGLGFSSSSSSSSSSPSATNNRGSASTSGFINENRTGHTMRKKSRIPPQASLDFFLANGFFQPPAPAIGNRTQRCDALRRFRLLAADQRPTLQRYATLAKAVFRADFSAIFMSNLKSASDMCIAASTGAPTNPCVVPISKTICGHAMLIPDQVLVIPNIKEEWCFTGLPCTQNGGFPNTLDGKGLSFYASAPIRVSPSGPSPLKRAAQPTKAVAIGRLCILAREPRYDWTDADSELLTSIAGMAGEALENDYLQHRAIKVSEMQRAMTSLARSLDEDQEQAEEKTAAGLAAAMSAANARDGQFRICPRRVEQACKHLRKALHADSVTAVDLSTFKVSTLHERRSTSGTTYPLTPWLPSPSPSLSFASVPTESNSPGEERSMPSLGSSPEAGKMTLPHSGTNMNANSTALSGGAAAAAAAAVLHTPTPTSTVTSTSTSSAGYSSFWHSHQQQPSSASSRTSISGSITNDVVVVTQHQTEAQHQHQLQAQHARRMLMQNEICAQLCDTETPQILCHFGPAELAPQLDGILQKKSLSKWLTRWRRGRNALRPQLYRQPNVDSEFDSDEEEEQGQQGRGEREDSGAGSGSGGTRLSFFEPPGAVPISNTRASAPSVGGGGGGSSSPGSAPASAAHQQPLSSSLLHSPYHAATRPGLGGSPHLRAYSLGPIDGLPMHSAAGGTTATAPSAYAHAHAHIPGIGRSASSTGSLAESTSTSGPEGAAATNPLGLLLPNARQYAALPIFPISRGNPVVLLIATFLDEAAVEDSELLFFESVGAVLYSSLLAQQARAVDRAQLSLIRGLQHEFRTPLHGILGIVDAIQSHEEHGDNTIASDPALLHNLLESIRLASTSLNGLLDDVLTFGEITGIQKSGRSASDAKASAVDDLDLGDLIEEVALEELQVRKMSLNQNEAIRASGSGSSHSDGGAAGAHGHRGSDASSSSAAAAAAAAMQAALQGQGDLQRGISFTAGPTREEIQTLQDVMREAVERDVSVDVRSASVSESPSGPGVEGDGAGSQTARPGSSRTSSVVRGGGEQEELYPPELVIDTLELLDRFRCDRSKIQKALRKIVSNALRFTTRGVVKITARQRARGGAEDTAAAAAAANAAKQVMVDIEVADTGPGMTQDFINNKLMEPFVKGSAFDSGVGLGNVIAASLVSQMGGHLHVASEVGVGTKITISLPLTPLGPSRPAMNTAGGCGGGGGRGRGLGVGGGSTGGGGGSGGGSYTCHAVQFLGCDNVGITSACDFLRKMLRTKNVLPIEEIGGLPDLLVISERVLDATYSAQAWEGSGLDDSVKKVLLTLPPHARVLVVSRGGTSAERRIDLGPLGARPIYIVQMPYGPSKLREVNDFLQSDKPFVLRPLPAAAVAQAQRHQQQQLQRQQEEEEEKEGEDEREFAAEREEEERRRVLSRRESGLSSPPSAAAAGDAQAEVEEESSDGPVDEDKTATAPAPSAGDDQGGGAVQPIAGDAAAAAAAAQEVAHDAAVEAVDAGTAGYRVLSRSESEDRGRLAQEAVRQMAQASASHRAADDEFRVLVVEDNPINLKLLTTLCKRLKMKYEEAKDGVEAVVKYLSFRPSVVLLDISLPEQDGFEAAAQMRSHPPFSTQQHPPRIVAITALSSEEDKIRGLTQCGMDIWLTKPVSTRALQKDLLEMEASWRALHVQQQQQQQRAGGEDAEMREVEREEA